MTVTDEKTEKPPVPEGHVRLTIDGFEISVPKGTLIIRAAERLGVQIPRFCDHPLLEPAGACRQCLVEVTDMGNGRGMPKPAASCTTTVMPGMVVKTQLTSAVADKAQQGVMEMLLINHPLDCPVCDKGGECPLQNQAMSNGRADSRFHDVKRTFPKPIAISTNVLLDRERCVLCQRCTRFSDEIAGDPFIDLLERGAEQQIGTSAEVPFQSYFSGNTVQICPVGVLPGGRLTEEDAYAYAKFARVALATNDVDFRARPGSDEELAFLGSHVAGVTPSHVSYASIENAAAVLLVGFEPEEESPIVFLRLHKSARRGRVRVWSIAALASNGLAKLGGVLVATVPGAEAAALGSLESDVVDALGAEGALILVGERLASSPGALSAAAGLAERTGAKLAWVPRRAGELGAIEAGALPTLLPGGRPVSDAAARAEVESVWDASLASIPGRDAAAILQAARDGALAALVVGGVDPADFGDPALASEALDRAGFIVSLEVRHSAITSHADVVLPVAPAAEKAGRYVTWEGRRRPFDLTLHGTGAMADGRVLHALAEELDIDLGLPTVEAARDELVRLGPGTRRAAAPTVAPGRPPSVGKGEAVLATWHELLDAGRMSDGDDNLAGTAKPARVLVSAVIADELGVADGDDVSVASEHGSIVLPAVIAELPDRVVWLPTNARGCAVRASLGVNAGGVV